jgi:hypothetical protein
VRKRDGGALLRGLLLLAGPVPMKAARRLRARRRLADPSWLRDHRGVAVADGRRAGSRRGSRTPRSRVR